MGERKGYPKSATTVSAMMVILDAVGIATGMAGYALASKAERYEWGAGETWIVCCLVGFVLYPLGEKMVSKQNDKLFKSIFCAAFTASPGH